jgi:hypothetical protein
VIAGHEDDIEHLLADLPPGAREFVAGNFVAAPSSPATNAAGAARSAWTPTAARTGGRRRCRFPT